jgi:8-oxo-dGTP pyrophosphatase MutT (NUDIX family)
MLGKAATIEIFGTLVDKKLYSGYITDSRDMRRVYVITDQELHGTIDCMIIASAIGETPAGTRLIAAPEGEVFYEPEIEKRLRTTSFEFRKINCVYEKSCGAVIYRVTEKGEIRILLVKNRNGKCWTFPKGHIESGESEEQTALREIKEETGLSVEIIPGFRKISTYRPFGRIKKTAVFFLAESKRSVVNVQPTEIDYYLWVSLDEAMKMCRHENDTNILKDVRKILAS